MDLKKWNKVINTNLNSNFMISNFFSKQMIKKKWGRIVNITSVVGILEMLVNQIILPLKQA